MYTVNENGETSTPNLEHRDHLFTTKTVDSSFPSNVNQQNWWINGTTFLLIKWWI